MFFILYAFFLRAAPRYFAIFVANEDEKETKLILLDKIEKKKQTNTETGRRKQSGTRVVKSGEDCHGFQMTKNLKIRVEFFNAQILNSYF